jgi:hypothetical protein
MEAWADALTPRGTTFAAFAGDWVRAIATAATPGAQGMAAAEPWRWRGPALVGTDAGVALPGLAPGVLGEATPRPWGMIVRRAPGTGPWRRDLQAPGSDGLAGVALVIP